MPSCVSPSNEFTRPVWGPIPENIEIYGMIESGNVKSIVYKRGKNAGQTGTIVNLKFRVLCGEHKDRTIYDSLFANFKPGAEIGSPPEEFANNDKFFALLELCGAFATFEDGSKQYLVPDDLNEYNDLINGTGGYTGKGLIGVPIGVKTGTREKVKYDKESGGDAIGPDGKPVMINVNTFGWFLEVPEKIKAELESEIVALVAPEDDGW